MKRISREEIDPKDHNLMEPLIDLTKLGTEDDPCFGKLHDLNAPECIRCGDNEFCQIVKSQRQHLLRAKESETTTFLDEEEATIVTNQELQDFVKRSVKKNKSDSFILRLGKKKYSGTEEEIQKLIDKARNNA